MNQFGQLMLNREKSFLPICIRYSRNESYYDVLHKCESVYGVCPNGAGYRGAVIGLIDPAYKESKNVGKVKTKHSHEEIYFNKNLRHPIKQIFEILPKNYTKEEVLERFQHFFPFQWQTIVERQQTYKEKAEHLYKTKGIKNRYNTVSAKPYFYSIPQVKKLLSQTTIKKYNEKFVEEEVERKRMALEQKMKKKNKKIYERIDKAKENMQKVDPLYLDAYISAYHKKGMNTQEKIEIVNELNKFDTEKTTRFFRKLNDSERNDMIRNNAFYHLQSLGHYVKLRKNFKGKKKAYSIEKATLDDKTPFDLYKDLKENKIQSQKKYDVFISHSSRDKNLVQKQIAKMNAEKKICYCDWTMDNDYLKRSMVSDYTK